MKSFEDVKHDARGHYQDCSDLKKPNGVCMCLTDEFSCAKCGQATQTYLIELKPETPSKWFGWCHECQHGRKAA